MTKPERLSGLDTSFLHLERSGAHMHVASTSIFEGEAPTHAEFREHIASRLHLVPRFRQKLRFVPFTQGRPVWIDDPHLNLDYHVRQTALPAPGSDEQLRNLAARIFSQQLDRSKPLWELWLVEGLSGDRFAIIGKSHHALVDGVSGVDITTVLFDLDSEPAGTPDKAPPWLASPEPTDVQLLTEAWKERLTSPKEIYRGVRHALRGPRQVLEGVGATSKIVTAGMAAPDTVFNVEIGPHRRFQMTQTDLDDLKRVKDAHGGTVNDVILSIVAGGIGRYLRARG
ncbi:MAG TPA: wax ester/triacylglycerol synthase domain-containing protein, partial [Solirubrobacterales bacterium]|nr:wax ester/triacylglycerol synthase domain-containing protein [Solirubrobacterales bacterium]